MTLRAKMIGERVHLRGIEPEDIDRGWFDWINDITLNQFIETPYPRSRQDLVEYIAACQPPNNMLFAVCANEDGTYIGNARLAQIDAVNRVAGYGRLIGHPDYRGKGYGTEALVLLMRYAFHHLGLNRVQGGPIIGNDRSIRSNEKAGMTIEGIMRQRFWKNGTFYDARLVSMLREDFDRIHGTPEEWEARERAVIERLGLAPTVGGA